MNVRTPVLGAVLLALVMTCTASDLGPDAEDPYAALRGILLDGGELEPRVVQVDGFPELPAAGLAYRLVPMTESDVRALADSHAGGPVEPGAWVPVNPEDMVSFDAGDGWFSASREPMEADGVNAATEIWSWTSKAFIAAAASIDPRAEPPQPGPCPAGTVVPADTVTAFFDRLGIAVRLEPDVECAGPDMWIRLEILVDGRPVTGLQASVTVDVNGSVSHGSGPLVGFEPLVDVPLAPAEEVLRRLVHGPGVVSGYHGCLPPCQLTTRGAEMGLAVVTVGGFGHYDHIPAGIVFEAPRQYLLPAVRLTSSSRASPFLLDSAVLAVSSSVLVDDPGQSQAAASADATSDPAGTACAGEGALYIAVCVSATETAAGTPVLFTVSGDLLSLLGCRPQFTLDTGDGSPLTSFKPPWGTRLAGRVAHSYDDPGQYTVTVRNATGCPGPVINQPGDVFTLYDVSETILVTVHP